PRCGRRGRAGARRATAAPGPASRARSGRAPPRPRAPPPRPEPRAGPPGGDAAGAGRPASSQSPILSQPLHPPAHLGRVPRARIARQALLVLGEGVLLVAEGRVGLACLLAGG